MHDSHGHGYQVRRPRAEPLVTLDGLSLLWIATILLVPAIFGVMFLQAPWRSIVGFGSLALTILICVRSLAKQGPSV
jgi:hypothetical protein